MNQIKFITSIAIIVAVVGSAWYSLKKKARARHINPYKIENPVLRDLTQYVSASGNLKAKDSISVGSLVAGKVIQILAEDNDVVKKDQVLAILDNGIGDSSIKNLKAALAEAKANLAYQTEFYKRQAALYKSGQLSKNLYEQYTKDFQVAQAKVDQTAAQLEIETKTYNNLFIKSPDAGIVIAKRVNLGQMITSQLDATVLFEIATDLKLMEAHIDVDEADIGMVKEKQDAFFTVDSFPKEKFSATVKRIQFQAKIIDNVVTYATVLDVENPELRLRPGMTANVDIKAAEAKQCLSISNRAFRVSIQQLENAAKTYGHALIKLPETPRSLSPKQIKTKDHLWVMENDKTIKQIEVQLGINDGKFTEIINSVSTNSRIIVDIEGLREENVLLKGLFARPGGIGK